MQRLAALTCTLLLLAGCATPATPATPAVAPARGLQTAAAARAKAPADTLRANVVTGMTRIFTRYDDGPVDQRLSFDEFRRVVTLDWFAERDANEDGYLLLPEWLTPAEITFQIAAIQRDGAGLVTRADRDGDQALTGAEFLAYTAFEVDPTPWLAGPADPEIKRHAFDRHAEADGRLRAGSAALLMGALLAQGYYLDDASQQARRGPRPPRRAL